MITKGNEIRLIRPMGIFQNIGEVCEVTDVSEDGVISFRFGCFHLGCMSYNEFEKYFELVETEDERMKEDTENKEVGNKELKELLEWCKNNDRPFYPGLYHNIVSQRNNTSKPILGIYANRLCLAQYRNKTFRDSDFSTVEIVC